MSFFFRQPWVFALAVTVAAIGALPSSSLAQTTVTATADSYVRDGGSYTGVNYGPANPLLVKNVTYSGYTRQVFLKFGLSTITAGAYNHVVLRMYGSRDPSGTITTTTSEGVHGVTVDSWTESGITFSNKPAIGTLINSVTVATQAAQWYEWDVSAFVLGRKSAGSSYASLALVMDAPPNPDESYDVFNSKEAASNKPQLVFSNLATPTPTPVVTPTPTPVVDVTRIPVADSYIRNGGSAGANYGTATTFQVKNVTAYEGYTRKGLLKFDLTGLSSTNYALIKLRLYGGRDPSSTITGTTSESALGATPDTWTESAVNWNNQPTIGAASGSVNVIDQTPRWYEWDVTSYVKSRMAAASTLASLAITMDQPPVNDESYDVFNSRESSANQPQLVFLVTGGTIVNPTPTPTPSTPTPTPGTPTPTPGTPTPTPGTPTPTPGTPTPTPTISVSAVNQITVLSPYGYPNQLKASDPTSYRYNKTLYLNAAAHTFSIEAKAGSGWHLVKAVYKNDAGVLQTVLLTGTVQTLSIQRNFTGKTGDFVLVNVYFASDYTNPDGSPEYNDQLAVSLKVNTDDNANGLPDWWELKYFGILGVDPLDTPNYNGVTNIGAYQGGINPTTSFGNPLPVTVITSVPDPTGGKQKNPDQDNSLHPPVLSIPNNSDSTTANLLWIDNNDVSKEQSIVIWKQFGSGKWEKLTTLLPGANSYNDTGLKRGINYHYIVAIYGQITIASSGIVGFYANFKIESRDATSMLDRDMLGSYFDDDGGTSTYLTADLYREPTNGNFTGNATQHLSQNLSGGVGASSGSWSFSYGAGAGSTSGTIDSNGDGVGTETLPDQDGNMVTHAVSWNDFMYLLPPKITTSPGEIGYQYTFVPGMDYLIGMSYDSVTSASNHYDDNADINLRDEYTQSEFIESSIGLLPDYKPFSEWAEGFPGSSALWEMNRRHSIKIQKLKFQVRAPSAAERKVSFFAMFYPDVSPGQDPYVVKSWDWTASNTGEEFILDPSNISPQSQASRSNGSFAIVRGAFLDVYDYNNEDGLLDLAQTTNGSAKITVDEGATVHLKPPSSTLSGSTYTVSWNHPDDFIVTDSNGQVVTSPLTLAQAQIGPNGIWFSITATDTAKGGEEFTFTMAASDSHSISLGDQNVSFKFTTEADNNDENYTIPFEEAAGARYRKLGINGRPLPDGKPQGVQESDQENEETYIDSLTLGLRHENTDVYIPIPGSDLSLSARRNVFSEGWTMRSGLRPHERADRPFGVGISSSLCITIDHLHVDGKPDSYVVTDENGSSHTFVTWSVNGVEHFVPMPTGRHEQQEYLAKLELDSANHFVFTKKFGTKLTFEGSGQGYGFASDRVNGEGSQSHVESHVYSRCISVEDRKGNAVDYHYYNASNLIPSTIGWRGHSDQTIYIKQNDQNLVTDLWDANNNHFQYTYKPYTYPAIGASWTEYALDTVSYPDASLVKYTSELVEEADQDPDQPYDGTRNHWHCDLKTITDGNKKTSTFSYAFDTTRKQYSSKRGYYQQTGLPRMISQVLLPGIPTQSTFTNNSSLQIEDVHRQNPNDPKSQLLGTLTGLRKVTVKDVMGNTTTYTFGGAALYMASAIEQFYSGPIESPKIIYYMTLDITQAFGTEHYFFDPNASLSLIGATDLSGNGTTYTHNDEWTAPADYRTIFPSTIAGSLFNGRFDDPTTETSALGTKTFEYNDHRIMKKVTDPWGRYTSYTIDEMDRRTDEKIYEKNGTLVQQTHYDYDPVFQGVVSAKTLYAVGTNGGNGQLKTKYELNNAGQVWHEIIDPDGLNLTTTYEYDKNGNKKLAKDPKGYRTWFYYDGRNRLVQVQHEDGSASYTRYDGGGNKRLEVDENGHPTQFDYDNANRLWRQRKVMQDGPPLLTYYNYNNAGSLTSVTDPNLNSSTKEYDALQRVTYTTNAANGRAHFEYGTNSGGSVFDSSAFKPTKKTDERNFVTDFTYDGAYRETHRQTNFGTGISKLDTVYDPQNKKQTVTDSLNHSTITEFDALDRVTKTTFADLKYTQNFYTSTGLKWKTVDERLNATTLLYDGAGRLQLQTSPPDEAGGIATTQTDYDDNGNIWKVTNGRQKVWEYQYDSRNRKTFEYAPTVVDADGGNSVRPVTQWGYDDVGNVKTVTNPKSQVTTTIYDWNNRPVEIDQPPVSINGATALTIPKSYKSYDGNGNVLTVTDVNLHQTTNTYTPLDKLWTTEDPNGNTITYGYDALGNCTSEVDGLGRGWTFIYDGLQRQKSMKNTLGKSVTFTFNGVNKATRTDGTGELTTYDYDARNRLKTETYSRHGVRTYFYDDGKNLTSVTESGQPLATVTYLYDKLDRVAWETSGGYTHHYQYDLAGNRTTVTYGGTNRQITSEYDDLNRLVTMVDSGTGGTRNTTYAYDLNGNLRVKGLPNGDQSKTAYDVLNRRTQITSYANPGARLLTQIDLTYEANGNLHSEEEQFFTQSLNHRTVVNTYDFGDRLQVEAATTAGTGTVTTTYNYDASNNRKGKSVSGGSDAGGTTYNYNSGNELINYSGKDAVGGTVTLTYDGNGNRKTTTADGGTTLTYDGENRLLQFERGTGFGGGDYYSYTYDYRSRRISSALEGVDPTKIVFSGGTSVAEYETGSSIPTVEYLRGSDWGGGVGGLLYTLRNNGAAMGVTHYDSRGDVVMKTDANGVITYQASYEAFGKRTQEYGSTLDRQRANTKDEDPTGLLNEGQRYRDLVTGAFITRDPAGFVDGPNLYAYVRQNPWTMFDPEGLATAEERKASADDYGAQVEGYEQTAQLEAQRAQDSYTGREDVYQQHKALEDSAKKTAEDMKRRADILANGTEGDYLERVREAYGINNPSLNEFAAFYANQFNDQATLNFLNGQNPAPQERLDANSLALALLFPESQLGRASVTSGAVAAGKTTLTSPASAFERTHGLSGNASTRNVQGLMDNMRVNGWQGKPIDVFERNGSKYILDGHHRVEAARRVGIEVPYNSVPESGLGTYFYNSADDVVRGATEAGSVKLRVR